MALHVQAYTLYSSVRPYGAAVLVAAVDREGPQLYMIEPSGIYYVGAGAAPDSSGLTLCQYLCISMVGT